MSEISRFQMKHKCSYSVAHRTLKAIDHITQTKGELLEILETENREELERYLIEYFQQSRRTKNDITRVRSTRRL